MDLPPSLLQVIAAWPEILTTPGEAEHTADFFIARLVDWYVGSACGCGMCTARVRRLASRTRSVDPAARLIARPGFPGCCRPSLHGALAGGLIFLQQPRDPVRLTPQQVVDVATSLTKNVFVQHLAEQERRLAFNCLLCLTQVSSSPRPVVRDVCHVVVCVW